MLQKSPINYIILGAFTFFESNLVFSVIRFMDPSIIISSAILTFSIFAICVYVTHKNRNNSYQISSYILKLVVAELVLGIVVGFIFGFQNVFLSIIQSLFTVAYILIDLHMLMNNKDKNLTIDDHVFAAMMIYTDLIRLFIKLAEILNSNDKKKDKN